MTRERLGFLRTTKQNRGLRAHREYGEAAADFGAAHGGMLYLDEALARRVAAAEPVKRHLGMIDDESQFIIEVFGGSQGQARQPVEFDRKLILHTAS